MAGRGAWHELLRASFADFWKVFGTIVYIHVHEVVADQPNDVCLLFVCEIDRWKPVKYDRFVLTLSTNTRSATNKMASLTTHDIRTHTYTCTGALHH